MTAPTRCVWFIAFLLPVVWQLWIPPFTGLADNGDFPKVAGRYALVPAQPSEQNNFHFWIREWKVDPGRQWVSQYWGSEVWLARLALLLERGGRFDMRWMGVVHASIFAVFAWIVAGLIGRRWVAGIVAVLAFCDAAYVTYFQSFYFDAAALLSFLVFVAAWWRYSIGHSKAALAVMSASGLIFALSKGPHAPAALLLALVLLATREKALIIPALLLVSGAAFLLSRTTAEYQATAYYNLAFYKLATRDATALDALKIRDADRRLVGTHAFEPTSPAQSETWLRDFYPAGGYRNALQYYARNPWMAMQIMGSDLRNEGKQIRAENLGNYERSTGNRYCTLSSSFGAWSSMKSWLFEFAPWHVFLFFPGTVYLTWRDSRLRFLLSGILLVAGYEFAVATLADALETYRHLLLFHVAYDWLTVLALVTVTSRTPRYHDSWT